jgi:hypothetical protein
VSLQREPVYPPAAAGLAWAWLVVQFIGETRCAWCPALCPSGKAAALRPGEDALRSVLALRPPSFRSSSAAAAPAASSPTHPPADSVAGEPCLPVCLSVCLPACLPVRQ